MAIFLPPRACPANCPQAAKIESPRVLRIVAATLPAVKTARKSAILSASEASNGAPGNPLNGIKLTLQRKERARTKQAKRAFLGIVHPRQHHIFESDMRPPRARDICAASRQHLRQRILAVNRH